MTPDTRSRSEIEKLWRVRKRQLRVDEPGESQLKGLALYLFAKIADNGREKVGGLAYLEWKTDALPGDKQKAELLQTWVIFSKEQS